MAFAFALASAMLGLGLSVNSRSGSRVRYHVKRVVQGSQYLDKQIICDT
jgi:hypothetical protein